MVLLLVHCSVVKVVSTMTTNTELRSVSIAFLFVLLCHTFVEFERLLYVHVASAPIYKY